MNVYEYIELIMLKFISFTCLFRFYIYVRECLRLLFLNIINKLFGIIMFMVGYTEYYISILCLQQNLCS